MDSKLMNEVNPQGNQDYSQCTSMDTSSDYQQGSTSSSSQNSVPVQLKRVHFEQTPALPHLASSSSSYNNGQVTNNPLLSMSNDGQVFNSILVTALPTPVTKEWQQSISSSLRNHLVEKLLSTTIENMIHHPAALQDPRMIKVICYFKKMEQELYERANSRSEYYHSVAEKIYNSLKNLEDERQKKREHEMREESHLLDCLIQETSHMTIGFEH